MIPSRLFTMSWTFSELLRQTKSVHDVLDPDN